MFMEWLSCDLARRHVLISLSAVSMAEAWTLGAGEGKAFDSAVEMPCEGGCEGLNRCEQ